MLFICAFLLSFYESHVILLTCKFYSSIKIAYKQQIKYFIHYISALGFNFNLTL